MTKILVTGANGQLGRCLQDAASDYPGFQFVFVSRKELDISDSLTLRELFAIHSFTHCINTAAYTNVEKAESDKENAFAINAQGVKNMAFACKDFDVTLLHISTDYVFDGKKGSPYSEQDKTNPLNVYGNSKLKGEKYIQDILQKYFIFRTSWLYSQYGHNFLRSILRMASEGKNMTITTEQIGSPTNANDLAEALLQVVDQNNIDYGIYHFSNSGETTWYGFAKAILEQTGKIKDADLAETNHYRTFAARPEYSVLDNSKAKDKLKIKQKDWEKSLDSVLKNVTY